MKNLFFIFYKDPSLWFSSYSTRCLLVFAGVFFSHFLQAQHGIPEGYFQFPIKPGQKNYLAGNMGELRATHFHAGIDIKTDGREGLNVYAAADGYVSRVKVSTSGYGNAMYITHPNGFTTVYAHLLTFSKPVADFVLKHQYQNESFEIEICPAKNQFTFKKGEIIGLSGNSGSSGGPHLHFEIRDSLENFHDPLLFGFKEIEDNLAPVVEMLAIKTFDLHSRVNGEFGRFEFKPVVVGKDYEVPSSIKAKGILGLEILAHDKSNYTSNKYGIANLEMRIDGKPVFSHKIEQMHFDHARKILIHTDFEVGQKTGKRFEKLYIDDGNNINIYTAQNNGKFNINDSLSHTVQIVLRDVFNNQRTVNFKIKGDPNPAFNVISKKTTPSTPAYYIQENILQIACAGTGDKNSVLAKVAIAYKNYELAPSYKLGNSFVYLWDLREGLPDSVILCSQTLNFGFAGKVPSQKDRYISTRLADLRFQDNTLFDTLYLDISKINKMYKIQNPYTPLLDNVFITIKPDEVINDKAQTSVYSITPNNSYFYEGGIWNDKGEVTFKTKYLSYFTLLPDSVPPAIKFASKTPSEVRFVISDNLSGVKEFKATINGKWLLMNYDHKRKLLWSSQLDKSVSLKGELVLEVWDNVCNKAVLKTNL